MKILVACEESQAVTKELRRLGHEAYSCDIIDQSGGHPEWHIKQDVAPLINGRCSFYTTDGLKHCINGTWDLLIAHPPCTYLSNAGARWLYAGGVLNEERYKKGLEAKEFFLSFLEADCPRIAVENPIPSNVYELPQYTQIIQPYEHGHAWSKKTCLWLKGLPPLKPTCIIKEHKPYCSSGSYSGDHNPKYKGASRKGGSSKSRSKTFSGIARAFAEQWAGPSYQEKENYMNNEEKKNDDKQTFENATNFNAAEQLKRLAEERKTLASINPENDCFANDVRAIEYAISVLEAVGL